MPHSVATVRVTDGVKKYNVVVTDNKIDHNVLRGLFQADIVALQYIDANTNTQVLNVCCIDGQYSLNVQENYIYKIIIDYTGTTSLTQIQQQLNELNDKFDRSHSTREKSLTPTNKIDSLEFNKFVSSVDEKFKDLTLNFDQKFNTLSNDVNMLYELIQPIIGRAIDPWDITARSQGTSISSLPKQVIINFYGIRENECMICGRCTDVVNAHIWPKHTHGENLLSMFGLAADNLNDPRNYLRLSKSLELAFDNKSITIIQQNGKLVLFVLDDILKQQIVSNTKYTFNDCHLWPLKFGNSNRPFLRIIAAHCRNSFIDAFRLKRIDYETYKLGYNSSRAMLNASPDGPKAKVFDWFERNEKMIKTEERS